jgi:polyisoprenoid-binding protein YceI
MNAAVSATSLGTQPTQWQIDPVHSAAHFSVRHLMISNVRGEFTKVSGNVVLDPTDPPKSTLEVIIDATSIDTREPQRDEHLRSADFLDVANHPTITFRSKKITPAGTDHYKVTGDLTIRGVTREVTFDVEGPAPPVKDPYGNIRTGVSGTAKVNRKDFGLAWNALTEAGGVMVGDEVSLTFEAELIQQSAAAGTK